MLPAYGFTRFVMRCGLGRLPSEVLGILHFQDNIWFLIKYLD